jgi:hypothetical protein
MSVIRRSFLEILPVRAVFAIVGRWWRFVLRFELSYLAFKCLDAVFERRSGNERLQRSGRGGRALRKTFMQQGTAWSLP